MCPDISSCFMVYHSISRYMATQPDTSWDYAASVMEAEWLTFNEACQLLRMSRPSMYRLINSGRVTPYKIPGQRRTLFKKKELDELPAPPTVATTRIAAIVAVAAKSSRPSKRRPQRT